MPIELYLAYLLACLLVAIVPGPTVTLLVANSLTHGSRASLLTVAGTQIALALMLAALAVGLASIIAAMGWWFDWLRLAGAAYLVWLGWKLLRAATTQARPGPVARPRGGFLLQGFLVMLSNPKVLLFFGAFIPQFVDPRGDYVRQVLLLGLTAMAVALLSDSAYALLSGRAAGLFSRQKQRLAARLSGLCLIGGGIWLALARSR